MRSSDVPGLREDLLTYYERELTYMRQMGVEFAHKHSEIARRLLLEPNRCGDPHVERLLEGFALLAARVHLKLNDDFSRISGSLLEVLYPHYTRPVPSMTIGEFKLDPEQGKLTTGLHIPKGSMLDSNRINGIPCKFQTVYDTTVWPMEVSGATWRAFERSGDVAIAKQPVAVLRVTLQCFPDVLFKALGLRSLHFYLAGDGGVAHALYELLLNNCVMITARDPEQGARGPVIELPRSSLRPMGFREDEGALPYTRRSFLGYRVLQEYFTFPEKFLFLELSGLDKLAEAGFGGRAEITFTIARFERPDRHQTLELGVSAKTLRLGCAPLVNLFPQIADPIPVDHTKFEYPLVPDGRRQSTTEVFSIDEVTAQHSHTREPIAYQPFYAFRHASSPHQVFWHVDRRPSALDDSLPTQVYLALADLEGNPVAPEVSALSVHCTCTNADLPSKLVIGHDRGDFQLQGSSVVRSITALHQPTPTLRPPLGKASHWNLISQLSLNYLSLVEEGREALQEILRLYNFSDLSHFSDQISGISRVASRRRFGVLNSETGASLVRGTRVEIEFDESQFAGGGIYLFASVLDYFLGHYVALNSFTQLTATTNQRKEALGEWEPRAGKTILV
jgi:type VI secretion system protein ImpG